LALLVGVLVAYSGAARRRDDAREGRTETDLDYKTRHDLIPLLEDTIKEYAFPRGEALEAVSPARAGSRAGHPAGKARASERR
jgi:hypothetical protein